MPAILPHSDSCRILDAMHLERQNLQSSVPRAERAKWLIFFSFLTVLSVFDTIHNYVARRGDGLPTSVAIAIKLGTGFWLPYFFLVPAAVFLVDRYHLNLERIRSFVIHGVAGLVFTYAHIVIAAIPESWQRPGHSYGGRFFFLLGDDFAIDYLLYCCIVVAAYMLQQYSALKEREVRASQLETGLAQAQLRAIQAQLNPHFFFNTLQGISSLALAGERDSVVEMLSRLSDLIRVSFDEHRPQRIPLSAEMAFLESYLAIQQLTFGDRLSVRCSVDADTLDADVPTMLLQPLVENAIEHGIAVKPGDGSICIQAQRKDSTLVLQVSDSGPGFLTKGPQHNGIGLSTTESRLQLLYHDAQKIEYGRSQEGGARVTIIIPFTVSTANSLARPERRVSA